MTKNQREYYRSKAVDSYNSRASQYQFKCALTREPFSENNFKQFNNREIVTDGLPLVELYTAKYWQWMPEDTIGNLKIRDVEKSINDNKAQFTAFADAQRLQEWYVEDRFPTLFPEEEFVKIYESDRCYYCKVTTRNIELLAENFKIYKKNLRGWKLELDRKMPNDEYSSQNCVMACYWCNNAKTDEFTADEFQPIADALGTIWKKRLRDAGIE
jgi:hypothetical protein